MSARPYIGSGHPSMAKLKRGTTCGRTLLVMTSLLLLAVAGSCSADDPPANTDPLKKAHELLQKATKAYNEDKWDESSKFAQEASGLAPEQADVQQSAGQLLFLSGKVNQSLPCFDKANQLDKSLAPHNWQRGVALGCAGSFEAGAQQFGMHHEVNPDDVENSAWYFLCVAKTKDKAAAEATLIPSRGDRRQPMMSVLKMLQGTLTPDEVLVAAKANTKEGAERKMAMFYGFLYVGLYYDSIGEIEKAASALDNSIAIASKDYMGRTAQIYREFRFAKTPSAQPSPAAPK